MKDPKITQSKVNPAKDLDESKKTFSFLSNTKKVSDSLKKVSENVQRKSPDSSQKGSTRTMPNFWKKSSSTKVPGTIKQIRGIKGLPFTTFPNKSPSTKSWTIDKSGVITKETTTTTTTTTTITTSTSTSTSTSITTRSTSTSTSISPSTPTNTESDNTTDKAESGEKVGLSLKQKKFEKLLRETNVDMKALRKASWAGIPAQIRGTVWQLLVGYLPPNLVRRNATLKKRREEYNIILERHYTNLKLDNDDVLKQIRVDVPRTSPGRKFFQHPQVQKSLERILYLWAVRHPASGYVQGINDLATPFYMVFLSQLTGQSISDYKSKASAENLTKKQLLIVEADCFWCLSLVLDAIQDHYTFAQPGLQKMVFKLQELINRIDSNLHDHIVNQEVQFIQFAFRWMNCLLMREISLPLIIRSWDTCLSEENGSGFKVFHVYICAAFLMRWEKELKTMEFQDLVMFLQSLPTKDWSEKEIETLLSQAYLYQTYYQDSPNHLRN